MSQELPAGIRSTLRDRESFGHVGKIEYIYIYDWKSIRLIEMGSSNRQRDTTYSIPFQFSPLKYYFRAWQHGQGGFVEIFVSFQQDHNPISVQPALTLRFLPSLLFPSLQLRSASSLLFKDLYSVRLFSPSSRIEQACFIAV